MHPNDLLAAIEWALRKAEAEQNDVQTRLMIIPALREMMDAAKREIGK